MKERIDTPVFIGCASSSGSSLMATMLNRHPDAYCGAETAIFNKARMFSDYKTLQRKLPAWIKNGLPTDGYSLYPVFLPHAGHDLLQPEVLLRCAAECPNMRGFVDAVQSHCLQETNKAVFAEKTPSNVYCFQELASLYPNCALVHPIRDGRDVVCSLMKRGHSIFTATSIWLYNTACGMSFRSRPNYIEYKYEDLVDDPVTTLRLLCEKISLPYDDRLLQPAESERAPELVGVWKNSPTARISSQSVGRFRTDLSEDDYSVFCAVRLTKAGCRQSGAEPISAFELLRSLGYEAEPPRQPISRQQGRRLARRDSIRRNKFLIRNGCVPRRALTSC